MTQPPDIDTLMQFMQARAIAYNRKNMTIRESKRPNGKVVSHITMSDTGKIVLATEERNGRLLRVLSCP